MADRKRSVYDERAGIFPARFFFGCRKRKVT